MQLSRDLNQLHPEMKAIHEAFIEECKTRGIKIITTNTWRPFEQQDELYYKGRDDNGNKVGRTVTNAKPGQTPHNYMLEDGTPASLAFDIVPVVDGALIWGTQGVDYALWEYIGAIGKKHGMIWGGKFRSKDRPHFQFKNSRAMLKERFPESWS